MMLLISAGGYSQEFTPGSPGFKSLFNSNDSNGIACYRIPAIAVTPNGDIIAVADERVPLMRRP
ncbi:MAG: sialidase family protein [Bacteroidales bacterium]